MHKPKSVEIGGLTYRISYVEPGKDSCNLKEKEAGCILQEAQEIYIDKNLAPDVTFLVIMHEVLHGIGDSILPNNNPFVKETFTNVVSHMLIQSLRSMGFLKFLT